MGTVFPLIEPDGSDSAALDNVAELLYRAGRPLHESMSMVVPASWQGDTEVMKPNEQAFYRYHSCVMEPWDGPALLAFCDGDVAGACLDRNGLRPARYAITKDGMVIFASEMGVVDLDPSLVAAKGRLSAGNMMMVDFNKNKIFTDEMIKTDIAGRHPYIKWVEKNIIDLQTKSSKAPKPVATPVRKPWQRAPVVTHSSPASAEQKTDMEKALEESKDKPDILIQKLKMFGYTAETMDLLMPEMASKGEEGLGSMGDDAALACLSDRPQLAYNYFQQLFAQVTNPPIDPIREASSMSLSFPLGPEGNALDSSIPENAHRMYLSSPILSPGEFDRVTEFPGWEPFVMDTTFPSQGREQGLRGELEYLAEIALMAVRDGYKLLVLSDRKAGEDAVPMGSLLAVGAIHQRLVKEGQRSKVGIVVETGDAREVHHHCCLLGFGADAIFPYLAYEAAIYTQSRHKSLDQMGEVKRLTTEQIIYNYQKSCVKGLSKVMSKMGISTVQGYKSAMIMEAVGIGEEVMSICFTDGTSRISGVGFEDMAEDMMRFHRQAYPYARYPVNPALHNPGVYQWQGGSFTEKHLNTPETVANLIKAVRKHNIGKDKDRSAFQQYSKLSNELQTFCTLRGQLELVPKKGQVTAVRLDEVEPISQILRRFTSGAMSYGSISMEAHTTLAAAMNLMQGFSNSGEGGEDPRRYGTVLNSQIKQVASGRFGVSIEYLNNAEVIQIKMAQGAKPGEGGELPGNKVGGLIAKTRFSTPGVGLISPPPHHDIYSIEDLAQLIFDLKTANPKAMVSVKLCSEYGVGIIACGVVKAGADHITITGGNGGTGAAKWTSIKSAGLPWEMGLSETQQALMRSGLRDRVIVETDGQIKTGMDVIKAAILGAEQFAFATAPLISMGCLMMRKCHLNTCPVGIATQDPQLRAQFQGTPEHVLNFFYMIAEEVREHLARLGYRSIEEIIGATELLTPKRQPSRKKRGLDLSKLLHKETPSHPTGPSSGSLHGRLKHPDLTSWKASREQLLHDRALERSPLEMSLVADPGMEAVLTGKAEKHHPAPIPIVNTDRSVGGILSHSVWKHGRIGKLADDAIVLPFQGTAGQSFGAWLTKGINLTLEGEANDYVGKGICGGTIAIRPPIVSSFKAEDNVIVGNVCLYGATSGFLFARGQAGERFAVRNSGAMAVVEGVGKHGCEYMTGGRIVILGSVDENFAAGMSGGIAYVLAPDRRAFETKVNKELVQIESLWDKPLEGELNLVKGMLEKHVELTDSDIGRHVLGDWLLSHPPPLYRVIPKGYREILAKLKTEAAAEPVIVVKGSEQKMSMKTKKSNKKVKKLKKNKKEFSTSAASAEQTNVFDEKAIAAAEASIHALIDETLTKAAPKATDVPQPNSMRGFMTYDRAKPVQRDPSKRAHDWENIYDKHDYELQETLFRTQAARCMGCGVPFCQSTYGCPLGNKIPAFNHLVYEAEWKEALQTLELTNNFPEFTGSICPAPCEGACTMGATGSPAVTIKQIELAIVEKGFEKGWIRPRPPQLRTGKRVAVVGSGPAGLAASAQLNKAGHEVHLFERDTHMGGLLMYGIPNPKLSKTHLLERRLFLLQEEGIQMHTSTEIVGALEEGESAHPHTWGPPRNQIEGSELLKEFDVVLLSTGALVPRSLTVPGANAPNIRHAMEFLVPPTRSYYTHRGKMDTTQVIDAKDKRVVVIGGGDTGTDCIATSIRLGATSVTCLDVKLTPPKTRAPGNPWPERPYVETVDYGHEEARILYGEDPRVFQCKTEKVILDEETGLAKGVQVVEFDANGVDIEQTRRVIPCELILLAMGYLGADPRLGRSLGVHVDQRGNLQAQFGRFWTNVPRVYTCGDSRRGASTVVWAISEGRQAAREIDRWLMGHSHLP
eukprot:gb/GEZN01000109.1/.p1 GENE.gb/GEZN01000109.1/~~gb/GEZN01000109.1/.p1  ORF type:complete len:2201 (-),score=377.63 gb/GEZN01000109.1/:420-6077(-)